MVTPDFGIANIKEFFSAIDSHEIAAGFKRMAKSGSNKIKFHGDAHFLTVRFTPEIQAKWKKVIEEFGHIDANPITTDVSKRASGEFAAAFKDGQILIEVKQNGKRVAFASEKTAENIREGKLQLLKNGKEEQYDSISILSHEDYEDIANTFVQHVQAEMEPAAVLSKESITATKETAPQQPPQQAPTLTAVQAAKKTAQAPLKKPKKPEEVEETELLRKEERELEYERDVQHEKLTEEREIERQKEKVEHSEIQHEAIKKEEITSEEDQGSSVPP